MLIKQQLARRANVTQSHSMKFDASLNFCYLLHDWQHERRFSLSLSLSLSISFSLSIYLSLSLSLSLSFSISLFIYIYISLSIYIYTHVYIYLSFSLFLYLYLSLFLPLSLPPSLLIVRQRIVSPSDLHAKRTVNRIQNRTCRRLFRGRLHM
jgi:hypothetical protein